MCIEEVEEYLEGALFRFAEDDNETGSHGFAADATEPVAKNPRETKSSKGAFYKAYHPASAWNGTSARLAQDGGRKRKTKADGAPSENLELRSQNNGDE